MLDFLRRKFREIREKVGGEGPADTDTKVETGAGKGAATGATSASTTVTGAPETTSPADPRGTLPGSPSTKVAPGAKVGKADAGAAAKGAIDGRLTGGIGKSLSKERIDELLWELELAMYEADVALPAIEKLKEVLREELSGKRVRLSARRGEVVEDALRAAVTELLGADPFDLDAFIERTEKPVKIMFVGVNGTGKTTTLAKLGYRYREKGMAPVLAAGDTFRAGAIEQIQVHADRLQLRLIKSKEGGDPAAVAFDAVKHAEARKRPIVLLDTAGRMQTNSNLMQEMAKIKRVFEPHLVIFVGDALAGNDTIEQAVRFHETVGLDGAILTKFDTDPKGGAALSIRSAVGCPILFLGMGQEYGDLVPYDPKWILDRIFGPEA